MKCLICLVFLVIAIGVSPSGAEDSKKPNVLMIAIDDLNDWVGPLGGHPQVKTPHMGRLAARGTTFLNAQCQSPLCNPSRTSMMTGLRPSTTGIYALSPWFRAVPELKDLVSLPQHFSQNGYKTLMAGKIYHGRGGRGKTDAEWDVVGPPTGVGVKPKEKLVKTPAPHPLVDWGTFPHKDEEKGDWIVADWTVDQLKNLKDSEEPFFLACGFFLPHVPNYATQKWFDMYPEDSLTLPPYKKGDREDTPRYSWYIHWKLPEPRLDFLKEAGEWKNIVRSYLATVSFIDSQVGRVLDALEEQGLADNTIVVLWSDHGFHLGEKRITGKNTLWDRSARVPLIFAGPGVSAGAKCSRPAELLDIYPTLSDLCQLPKREGLEGHSLVPQLKDASAPREFPAITTHGPGNHGIRTENWRYIRYADGTEELYDMQKDPNEWTNLASNPEYTDQKKKLAKWVPTEDAAPAPGSKPRLIERKPDGSVYWELEEIPKDAPIPELKSGLGL